MDQTLHDLSGAPSRKVVCSAVVQRSGQRSGGHAVWSQLMPVPIRWLCRAVLVDAHASGRGGGLPAVWGLAQEVSGPSQPGVRSCSLF